MEEFYDYDKEDIRTVAKTSIRTRYDMEKYDCLNLYPCIHSQVYTPKAIYRHINDNKFIMCHYYDCTILDCPQFMKWYQEFHKCLIPIDYVKLQHLLNVTEEEENHTKYIKYLKTGFYEQNYISIHNNSFNVDTTTKIDYLSSKESEAYERTNNTEAVMNNSLSKSIKNKTNLIEKMMDKNQPVEELKKEMKAIEDESLRKETNKELSRFSKEYLMNFLK